MKARITLSLLFALLVASTPARADMLTGLLIDATRAVLTKATHVVVDTAKETFATKESEEDRKARENEEIEKAADQILAQYPEDQREAKKPDVMMRLTKVYAQYKTLDARQAAVRAEQNSVGNVVIESVAGSASGFLNNRMALDNAARSAFARWR
ncbi:MAG: hypothetical protein KJ716_13460 [Gammaproteobacteria bacterium]|jgi:hypothetical protein|nr:hypothetical protein [Gammaproteobacteria bacterium]MBU2451670.1 hypothetical protein [Gammaproteobacteria bacterium]